jgi:hypothetical protein
MTQTLYAHMKKRKKRAGGVAQGVGLSSNPSIAQKKKDKESPGESKILYLNSSWFSGLHLVNAL